jgi:hypothetical protein
LPNKPLKICGNSSAIWIVPTLIPTAEPSFYEASLLRTVPPSVMQFKGERWQRQSSAVTDLNHRYAANPMRDMPAVDFDSNCCRSSASLSRVTRCDQRIGDSSWPQISAVPNSPSGPSRCPYFFGQQVCACGLARTRRFPTFSHVNSMLFQPKTRRSGSVPLPQCRNSHVPKALMWLAARLLISCLRALEHWIPRRSLVGFFRRVSAAQNGGIAFLEFAGCKHWSSAAWPP